MKPWQEKLSFGVAVVSTGFFLVLGSYTAYQDHRRSTTFRQTSATIEDVRINRTERGGKERFAPVVRYRFEVDRRPYVGTNISPWVSTFETMYRAKDALRGYERGQRVVAYYDPANPSDAFLKLERSTIPYWFLTIGIVLTFFVTVFLFPSILLRLGVRPISPKSVAARRQRYRFRFFSRLHPSTPPPFVFTLVRLGLGPLIQLVGLSVTAASMIAILAVGSLDFGPFLQLSAIVLFVGLAFGANRIRQFGINASSPDAELLLARDPRPPVLYLRSFEDDESSAQDNLELPIFGLLIGRSDEDRLMRTLAQLGPVIAVGRPGEWLPPAGAARLAVKGGDWRDEVDRLCDQARIVVLRAGFTDGFWWEVGHVWERVPRNRILFWFPLPKHLIDVLERNREFDERFRATCGVDLPSGGFRRFVYFTLDGVPISPDAPPVERFSNIDRDIARQLEPFARSLGVQLRMPRAVSATRIISLLVMAPLVIAIGVMLLWFAVTIIGQMADFLRR